MNIFEQLGIDIEYVVIGLAAVIVLMFIMMIIMFVKISKQKKRITKFMSNSDAQSLEGLIENRLNDFEESREDVKRLQEKVERLDELALTSFRKTAVIKYDAFKEMGGKLSFVLALLNDNNTGFLINSMHSSREGCFTYIKEIIDGKSFVTLSDEEKQALEEAVNSTNYME